MPPASQWLFGPFRLDPRNACLWRGAEIVPLPEVFRLVGVDAMNAQEREFLPSGAIYAPQPGVLEPEAVGASRN